MTRASSEYKQFITALRLARMSKGVSQRELARRLNVHHSRIHRAEELRRDLDIVEVRAWLNALELDLISFTRDLDVALSTLEQGTGITGNDASSGVENSVPNASSEGDTSSPS